MKRIVVFCDGTWNESDTSQAVTNVQHLYRLLLPSSQSLDQNIPQIGLYHAGIGIARGQPGSSLSGAIAAISGFGTEYQVRQAYASIAGNYEPGDEIHIVGFSRGSLSALLVARMVTEMGILRKSNLRELGKIWKMFTENDYGTDPAWIHAHSHAITTLALFDTVSSMYLPGAIGSRILKVFSSKHSVFYNPQIQGISNVFHVLAMDEKRGSFWPIVLEPDLNSSDLKQCKQLWMPGCHADIGGGGQHEKIAGISLVWMASQLQGLLDFDISALIRTILDRFPLSPTLSKPTTSVSGDDGTMVEALWSSANIEESLTWFWTVCDICYRRPAGYPVRKGPHLRFYEGIRAFFAAPYRLLYPSSRHGAVPEISSMPPFAQHQLHPLAETFLLRRHSYRKTWWNLQQRLPNTSNGEIAQMNPLEQDIWERVIVQSRRENEDAS